MPPDPASPARPPAGSGRPHVSVDGRAVPVEPGQSVAAVLIGAAGMRSWRTTRITDRPRGVFCGIGICFDCLVTLNGTPNVRACVTPAAAGDVISTQKGTGRGHLAC